MGRLTEGTDFVRYPDLELERTGVGRFTASYNAVDGGGYLDAGSGQQFTSTDCVGRIPRIPIRAPGGVILPARFQRGCQLKRSDLRVQRVQLRL